MCEVLEVSRSGFYAWRSRPESERSKHHRELIAEIQAIHTDRDMKSYGSPRVHQELVARGNRCSENTVARLMRVHGVAAKTRRKYKVTTDSAHSHPLAENVLNREFPAGCSGSCLAGRPDLHLDAGGLALLGSRARCAFA